MSKKLNKKAKALIDRIEANGTRMENIVGILEYLADDACKLPNSADVFMTIMNAYTIRKNTKSIHFVYVASKVCSEKEEKNA